MKDRTSLSENRWGMKALSPNGLKIADLFCGAGIGAAGFLLAGYEIVYAVDNNPYAVEAYRRNIGEHVVLQDIRNVSANEIPEADLYVAGFPCQPFSVAGKGAGVNDRQQGDLGYHFVRLVREGKPKVFLLENVGGLISKKHKSFFEELLKLFDDISYHVTWKYINCHEYGVPQIRKRVFMVGVRKDIGKSFEFPPTIPLSQRPTIRDAIGDLPEPDGQHNHYGYGIRPDEAPFIDKIPIGGNWRDLPEEEQKQFLGKAFYSGGGKTGFLRKVSFDAPAYTITSVMNGKNNAQIIDNHDKYLTDKLPPHIPNSRRFTIRECLRLQTVPDWFSFPDNISLTRQYEMCGNGIPSLITYQLGISIAKRLLFQNKK